MRKLFIGIFVIVVSVAISLVVVNSQTKTSELNHKRDFCAIVDARLIRESLVDCEGLNEK